MIPGEMGRMTSRVAESRVPEYGGFAALPRKG
jgi:hypothetical protein